MDKRRGIDTQRWRGWLSKKHIKSGGDDDGGWYICIVKEDAISCMCVCAWTRPQRERVNESKRSRNEKEKERGCMHYYCNKSRTVPSGLISHSTPTTAPSVRRSARIASLTTTRTVSLLLVLLLLPWPPPAWWPALEEEDVGFFGEVLASAWFSQMMLLGCRHKISETWL